MTGFEGKFKEPTVNDHAEPILPVEVHFHWEENGPVEEYTFDGDSYPYISPEPASRYIMHTTFIGEPIEFTAAPITPAGVQVLEYRWDFGDGFFGFGPNAVHEYKVVEPGIEVKLTVVDTRRLVWSAAKPMNLTSHAYGYVAKQFVPR